jgi:3-dehydroquinate dehydratase-2
LEQQNMKILILNGPNLNLLGRREPQIYGTMTLDALNREVSAWVDETLNATRPEDAIIELAFFQSNHEGLLIDTLQAAPRNYDGIVYNPAGHTHYSIALRDAIAAIPTPVVEVHLSDISAREQFRQTSVMADVCIAQYMGQGAGSYKQALQHLVEHLDARR